MRARHVELEVIKLLAQVGRWPAGTTGTVVRSDETIALIEISDDRGHGLDFVSVPQAAVSALGVPQTTR